MAISINNVVEVTNSSSFSYTPSNVTDACLVFLAGNEQDFDDPLAPEIDSVLATEVVLATLNNGGAFDNPFGIYQKVNPGTSAVTISSEFDDENIWLVMTLGGVNQTTPINTGEFDETASENVSTVDTDLTTTVDGSLVIAGSSNSTISEASSVGSNQTIQASANSGGSGQAAVATSEDKATAGAVTSTINWGASQSRVCAVAAAFNPVAVAGGIEIFRRRIEGY